MVRTEKCPVCQGKSIQILKKRTFAPPEMPEYDSVTGDITFRYERLQILFEKILKDRSPRRFDIDLCLSCGFIFQNPRFTTDDIKTKYKTTGELESYWKRIQKLPALKTGERAQRIYSLIAGLQREGTADRRLLENLKILDFGGAEGYNLVPFTNSNSCYLIDYVKFDLPTGVNYLGADESDLQSSALSFDVILLCHVLEHVTEPTHVIEVLSAHLVEGGLLYVEVPLGCFREWQGLNEPLTHVNFFSEESLFRCLTNSGLCIVHLSTAYQWVSRDKLWCINIIAKKELGGTHMVSHYKTARHQMNSPRYYLPLLGYILRHPKKLVQMARRRLKSLAVS